jgi:hypothetical protein
MEPTMIPPQNCYHCLDDSIRRRIPASHVWTVQTGPDELHWVVADGRRNPTGKTQYYDIDAPDRIFGTLSEAAAVYPHNWPRLMLRSKDAAIKFGLKPNTLVTWRAQGTGPTFTKNEYGDILYDENDIWRYIGENRHLALKLPAKLKRTTYRTLLEPMQWEADRIVFSTFRGHWEFIDPRTGLAEYDRSIDPRYRYDGGGYHLLEIMRRYARLRGVPLDVQPGVG